MILTINAGSSSIKSQLFEQDAKGELKAILKLTLGNLSQGTSATNGRISIQDVDGKSLLKEDLSAEKLDCINNNAHKNGLLIILENIKKYIKNADIKIVSHRVVHGGNEFSAPVVLNDANIKKLESYKTFAPLHQPWNLLLINTIKELMPNIKQVASFDTAFHANMPRSSADLCLPKEYTQRGLKRYGFHGISYQYILGQLALLHKDYESKKIIIAHLGAGASLCAIKNGKGFYTTMGFTPIDGVMMATRSGAIDPGVLIHLMREGKTADEIEELLNKKSGLLGVSGVSGDMLTLLDSKDPDADYAIDLFARKIAQEIGRLSAAIEGIDILTFTGGIGENDELLRARVMNYISWLGFSLNKEENDKRAEILNISTKDSKKQAYAIRTNEEKMMAINALKLVQDK